MQKNVIIYGLIAGTIVSTIMLLSINLIGHDEASNIDLSTSMLIGYASMVIAFSLVFVGIRNYRNKYNGGVISFGMAFKVGILIVLVASTMYVVAWLINYFFFTPDFIERYSAQVIAELKAGGASQAEIDKEAKSMESFAKMYKNPFFNAMITYVEILPVGLVVTVISSLILKRRTPKSATA